MGQLLKGTLNFPFGFHYWKWLFTANQMLNIWLLMTKSGIPDFQCQLTLQSKKKSLLQKRSAEENLISIRKKGKESGISSKHRT